MFDKSVAGDEAKRVGDLIRVGSGTDQDTGVVTQCYRVAGTPNYPSKAKQARGRTTVEPTRLVEWTGFLWEFEKLEQAYAAPAAPAIHMGAGGPCAVDETSLPDELLKDIRDGGVSRGSGAKGDKSRSGLFHHVVGELKKRRWTSEQIHALLEKYPNGVAAKYPGRLADEIRRSYDKIENGNGAGSGAQGPIQPSGPSPTASAGAAASQGPRSSRPWRRSWRPLGRLPLRPRRPLLARLPGPLQDLRRERGLKPDMCCPPSGSSPDSCRA